jgi:hypothetical protein
MPDSKTANINNSESSGNLFHKPEQVVLNIAHAVISFFDKDGNKIKEQKLEQPEAEHKEVVDDKEVKSCGLMIWKDTETGQYRWFTSYSNNYREDDRPAEIISKESHKNFEKMIDEGEVDYPELWHWHLRGSAWGKADWIAFDEENGIAMASGYVYSGHEKEAESLSILGEQRPIGVSHGMPVSSIVRNETDPTIIRRHVTVEISDLPLEAAANKLTSFYIFEESEMAIPDKKKEYLRQAGVSDEMIEKIEQANRTKAQTAEALELESKEQNSAVTETVVETSVESNEETQETPETQETQSEIKEEPVTVEFVTTETFTLAIQQIGEMLVNKLDEMSQSVKQLSDRVDAVETKEKTDNIPTASLAAILAQSMSVTTSKEARVNANNPLAKSGPVETESSQEESVYSSNPLTNAVIKSVLGK